MPLLVNLMPSGEFLMEDFYYAGGLPAVIKEMADYLHGGALTVNGRSLAENCADAPNYNREVIASIDPSVRFSAQKPKGLLINAFSKDLPNEVINRDKMGFTFPFSKWFSSKKDVINEILCIKNDKVKANYTNFLKGRLHWSRLWSLLVLNNKVFA